MAGWYIQLLAMSFILLSGSPGDAYQLDQFYSFSATEDDQIAGSAVSAMVALNGKFQFNQASKSYINVSLAYFVILCAPI